ncbi:MAG: ATP-dependent RecD-like DNA helicase [Clostridia bacterium]
MKIVGTVENIIFRNEENMYTVLELETEDSPVTATGIFPTLSEGETVELEGEYKESKYGLQFVAQNFKSIGFANIEAVARFLAGGLFKGVGEVTARRITSKFKENTFDVIEKTPDRLTEVPGISKKKAVEIANSYRDVIGMREAVIYLTEKGLTFNLALKIFNQYKNHTISTINKNPYKLVEDIDGVGFKTADEVAEKLGVDKNSDFRMRAGFLFVLKENARSEGSTCLPFDELCVRGCRILEREYDDLTERFEKILADLILDSAVKMFYKNEIKFVAMAANYFLERNLSALLQNIERNAVEVIIDGTKDIAEFEKVENITLHKTQKEAVLTATQGGLTIITGGPGTGKTTIIKCIIHIFKKQGLKVALVAPTGRAAKRLSEATCEEAKTIHRMLDLGFKDKGVFTYNDDTKLDQDILIVDEVSMTDVYVMKSLMNAVKFGGRVILVGDKDQLPSVGAGNVLSDMLESKKFNTVMLTEVYRQGKESMIVTNAHKINNGEMPDLDCKDSDFFYSKCSSPNDMQNRIVEMVKDTLPKFCGAPSKEIQILVPTKKGMIGVEALNRVLQNAINPSSPDKNELEMGNMILRVGDKVMQTVNNYQMEWVKEERGELQFGTGVFNGDIGEIIEIDKKSREVKVLFEDGRNMDYGQVELSDLVLSYAISIHKSQGSEFDVAIIPITAGSPALFTRNLLYTAITRAKKIAVLMGDKYNIQRMVDNNYIEKRYTMLKDFLEGGIS